MIDTIKVRPDSLDLCVGWGMGNGEGGGSGKTKQIKNTLVKSKKTKKNATNIFEDFGLRYAFFWVKQK